MSKSTPILNSFTANACKAWGTVLHNGNVVADLKKADDTLIATGVGKEWVDATADLENELKTMGYVASNPDNGK